MRARTNKSFRKCLHIRKLLFVLAHRTPARERAAFAASAAWLVDNGGDRTPARERAAFAASAAWLVDNGGDRTPARERAASAASAAWLVDRVTGTALWCGLGKKTCSPDSLLLHFYVFLKMKKCVCGPYRKIYP